MPGAPLGDPPGLFFSSDVFARFLRFGRHIVTGGGVFLKGLHMRRQHRQTFPFPRGMASARSP